jgi:hypothetical protein
VSCGCHETYHVAGAGAGMWKVIGGDDAGAQTVFALDVVEAALKALGACAAPRSRHRGRCCFTPHAHHPDLLINSPHAGQGAPSHMAHGIHAPASRAVGASLVSVGSPSCTFFRCHAE